MAEDFTTCCFQISFQKWKQLPAMPKTWARNSSSNWAEQDPLANIFVCSAYFIYFGLPLVLFGHGVGLSPPCPEMFLKSFPRCFPTAYKTGRLSSRHPPGQRPLGRHPQQTPPPTRDGHCSGRYASYCNVFLSLKLLERRRHLSGDLKFVVQ